MKKNKWLVWLLVIAVTLSVAATPARVSYADPAVTPEGYVTLDVEKFTLGQGYIKEPVKVPFYEGDNGAALVDRLLGEENYKHSGSIDSAFYLSKVKDNDSSPVQLPSYLTKMMEENNAAFGGKVDENWLGEFDYTFMSGWMYAVNNAFPPVGFSNYEPQNGDVIRVQFTVFGYGTDLGSEWGDIRLANKDDLTEAVAEINSSPDKQELLNDEKIGPAYEHAYATLENIESTQEEVNSALTELAGAQDKTSPSITVNGFVNNQIVTEQQLPFSVSVTDNVPQTIDPEVKLNGNLLQPSGGQYTAGLVSGLNTIVIKAADGAGNQATQTYTVTYKASAAGTINQYVDRNLAYLLSTVSNPVFGTLNGEWSVLTLARGNYQVPDGYYDTYYNKVVAAVQDKQNVLDPNKYTEHSRVILALTSIGKDVTNVGGFNQLEKLADFNKVIAQGINGPTFALLALDSHNYDIPAVAAVAVQSTRANLIQYMVDMEIKKGTENAGGWGFGSFVDVDLTAMALQALAPYYNSNPDVKSAADRAVAWLSKSQSSVDGGYSSSESIAQVIVALSALGIDSNSDPRFVKNGHSLIDAFLLYALPDGGFRHTKTGGVNGLATDQGTYALVAYDRFLKQKKSLYDMTDVTLSTEQPANPGDLILPAGNTPQVAVPDDSEVYRIPVTAADSGRQIGITIPGGKTSDVKLSLPLNTALPRIEAVKGNNSILIPQGTQVTSGDSAGIQLLTTLNAADSALQNQMKNIVASGKKLDDVAVAFSMGGSARVQFNQFVTLTLKGMGGKSAAYIEGGVATSVAKFASDALGLASGKNEYAYDNGSDLIIKTNHFTDYVAFAESTIVVDGGGSNPPPTVTKYVTLSVDKLTINKGYTVASTKIELRSGDTAWSVLKRILDSKGLTYEYVFTSKYNSVYVQSIAGDGEFDHGSGSGWMYNVNGVYPNYGASLYELKDGDKLQWRYTTDLGIDLGVNPDDWETPGENGNNNGDDDGNTDLGTGGTGGTGGSEGTGIPPATSGLEKLYSDASKISSWAKQAIEQASEKGFVQGSGGKFHPQDSVTRAEFAKMLVSILALPTTAPSAGFTDITTKDWFAPYVNAVAQAGYMNGYQQHFNPNASITREEMAVTIVRALGIKAAQPQTAIKDLQGASVWAQSDIATIVEAGLMTGSSGKFDPHTEVTREMAAVVAMRSYDYKQAGNSGSSPVDAKQLEVQGHIKTTAAFLQKTVTDPVIASVGGEWTVLGLARSGMPVPDSYFAKYYSNVEQAVKEKEGKLHSVKYTEYDRVILALTAIGRDIHNVAGYDLTKPLADYETVIKQGINGPIFALIALDSKGYSIPADPSVKTQTTKELLIDFILNREIAGGGWALGEKPTEADPDITAMVLQALAPYYNANPTVKAAVERSITWLSKAQQADGGYASGGAVNSESSAQVVVALTALGIDPQTDSRFVKNGRNVLDALLGYSASGGGFYHVKSGGTGNGGAQPGEVDLMATDQAFYALVAYDRFKSGNTRLYDMTDVK
ncbi:S-layer homology domain-containing protein [Paenibacillus sp. JDR-2]|uniref:S-layer homology domain-containing protein n=1 Tax=Paenibacillus sp. (strain JDR-2) TaxID=324057 RepID=UPI0001667D37|nr:S-layer homology domain-containing protein [Paenibacillus sp. JDR-2]ACT01337.1 S-layer domain protein [Paenibacillus sp. JDR-2]